MPGQGRLGDKSRVPLDAHGCVACPHPTIGPAIAGSLTVQVNKRPALRVGDPGVHAACCAANTWQATTGSPTVFIDGKAAHRQLDQTRHCGGVGQLVEGSPNVIVGDTTTAPAMLAAPRAAAPVRTARPEEPAPAEATAAAPADAVPAAAPAVAALAAPSPPADEPAAVAAAQATQARVGAAEAARVAAQVNALRAAAAGHLPFCEECERRRTAAA